jgi:hypothetical protein
LEESPLLNQGAAASYASVVASASHPTQAESPKRRLLQANSVSLTNSASQWSLSVTSFY